MHKKNGNDVRVQDKFDSEQSNDTKYNILNRSVKMTVSVKEAS